MPDPFSALILWLRRETNQRLGDVATQAGADVAALSAWENGRKRPNPNQLGLLVQALGVDPASDLGKAAHRLWELPVQPPPKLERSDLTFVSYVHQDGTSACPCNECRSIRFHENRCIICQGSGLRPGFDALEP